MEEILLNPNLVYLFIIGGFSLAFMAILAPGTGILEITALFVLILAGWGVFNLPINYWALTLLIIGVFPPVFALRKTKADMQGPPFNVRLRGLSGQPFSRHGFFNRFLLLGGVREAASAFFAAIRGVGHGDFTGRAGHGDFALPRPEFAKFRESRDHEDQLEVRRPMIPTAILIESESEMRMAWQKRSIRFSICHSPPGR